MSNNMPASFFACHQHYYKNAHPEWTLYQIGVEANKLWNFLTSEHQKNWRRLPGDNSEENYVETLKQYKN